MTTDAEINIFDCLEGIQKNAPRYAEAKAQREYLEDFLKSKKAILMSQSTSTSAAMQERDALAHAEYIALIEAKKDATEKEVLLRWALTSLEAKIGIWRSLESSRRVEVKTL